MCHCAGKIYSALLLISSSCFPCVLLFENHTRTDNNCSLTFLCELLIQMILDPYYRTIEGLCVLIEKDWCGFGHKFQDRIGHVDSNYQSQERSPIFIQWLEVIFQLMVQFPSAFEYTEKLLVFVGDHLYSGLFGNFLGNNDRERKMDLDVVNQTRSIWTYVLSYVNAYTNINFVPHNGPIWPCCTVRHINTWDRCYHRWDSDMHSRAASGLSWK